MTMREVKPEQLGWISWLRFFAICGVITIHAVGFTVIAEGARDSRAGILAIILDLGAVFTVPLFVMLSGAVLLDPQRYTDPGNFYRKRLNRLVPAIVFWHLFYWAFRIYVQDRETSPREALRLSLNGDLVTALYFFWIVLGLAVVSPALISWIAASTRRQIIVGGLLAASMPVLSTATLGLRGGPLWVETPWTWWIFYLGLFILGWGLRGVALHGPWLVGATGATMALAILMPWQWNNPDAPGWLQQLAPVSYYGITVQLYAVLIFLVGQSLIHSKGALRVLVRPRLERLGRTLGDATLGVFALHFAIISLVVETFPVIGGEPAASSSEQLVARVATVIVVTYAIVLVLRRVPVVRRVL